MGRLGSGGVEKVVESTVVGVDGYDEGDELCKGDTAGTVEAMFGDDGADVFGPVEWFIEVGIDEGEGAHGHEALDQGFVLRA